MSVKSWTLKGLWKTSREIVHFLVSILIKCSTPLRAGCELPVLSTLLLDAHSAPRMVEPDSLEPEWFYSILISRRENKRLMALLSHVLSLLFFFLSVFFFCPQSSFTRFSGHSQEKPLHDHPCSQQNWLVLIHPYRHICYVSGSHLSTWCCALKKKNHTAQASVMINHTLSNIWFRPQAFRSVLLKHTWTLLGKL